MNPRTPEREESIRAKPSEWFCNKCGYVGDSGPHHLGCDYHAGHFSADREDLIAWLDEADAELVEARKIMTMAQHDLGHGWTDWASSRIDAFLSRTTKDVTP